MAKMGRLVSRAVNDPIARAQIRRQAEMDLRFRAQWPEVKKQLDALSTITTRGGSGFRMAKILRRFYQEYTNRLPHGPGAMPSSFNVSEAFLDYSADPPAFHLREEREYLLRLYEYFNWYTAEEGALSRDPAVLESLTLEGVIYSYDMLGALDDFKLNSEASTIAILGLSMIRYKQELSLLLVAGENPPFPPDNEFDLQGSPFPGKASISIDPSLTVDDRIVPGLVGFGHVILLARADLQARRFEVRYACLDLGPGYMVLTDDPTGLRDIADRDTRLESMKQDLRRYDELFSAMAALIYLPAFFITKRENVEDSTFATELSTDRHSTEVNRAIRVVGSARAPFSRVVHCLVSDVPSSDSIEHLISAPGFQLNAGGYWMSLAPGEVGVDDCGNSIIGRTWVEKHESWSSRGPESLLIRKTATKLEGADPGFIYIMRSPSHAPEVYKIGITRRHPVTRAGELSHVTGVPLPFGVLAQWEAGDCSSVETGIHQRLGAFRINKKREFFKTQLSTIVTAIEESIALK